MNARQNKVNDVDQNSSGDDLYAAIEMFHFAFRAFTAGPDAILAELGLGRVHHRILYFVGRSPALRVSDLLVTLGVSKQALHGPLRQLTEADLIVVTNDANDGRVRRLSLSKKGIALEQRLSRTQRQTLKDAFTACGPQAEAGWRKVMTRIASGLNPDDAA